MNRKMLSSLTPRYGYRAASLFVSALFVVSAAHAEGTVQVTAVPGVLAKSTVVGTPSQSQALHFSFALPPSSRSAFQDYANRVSNSKDSLFRHFLTPAQVGAKFGPSTATLSTVTSYLRGKGFTIKTINGSRLSFLADATVKQAESTFGTKFYNYQLKTEDARYRTTFYANSTPLKLPISVGSKIFVIGGASNAIKPQPEILDVTQTRTLYNTAPFYSSGKRGQGISIGMVNYDGYRLTNVPLFYSQYGLPAPAGGVGSNINQVSIAGSNGNTQSGIDGEGDLDIQMILGMAPLCNLYIYDGANADQLAVYTEQASDNLCDIISESWEYGFSAPTDDALATACHDQRVQMTIQGITMASAAGDFGAIGRGDPYPHFDSEVLQIGGTIATVGSTGVRASEVAWSVASNSSGELGGGGGWFPDAFTINTRPPYQSASAPYNFGIRTDINKRLFPDISFNAAGNNSGAYYFFVNGALSGDSVGTSFACPIFSGMLGVVEQQLISDGFFDTSSHRLGRLQDTIYPMQGDPSVYFDITSGTIGPLPDGTQAAATAGWDFATGWGAVDMGAFENSLLATASVSVSDAASSANVYTINSPSLTLGTVVGGDVSSLPNADGVSYVLRSVKQNGLGQTAAATVTIPLQTAKKRNSASLSLVMETPTKATGYLYLLNATTGAYDLINTIAGTGAMTTTTVELDTDANTYISGNTVTVLVRSIMPTRLGTAPYNTTIDQVSVTERVARG